MKSTFTRRSALAFTLLELMLVIAIISLLIGLLFAGITSARKAARKAQAVATISTIATGLNGYHTTYGFWPSSTGVSITNSGSHFVNCVMGNLTVVAGNTATITNPRGIRFCDLPGPALINPSSFNAIQLIDSYGKNNISGAASYTVFSIYVDTNNDNWISATDIGTPAGFPHPSGSLNRTIAIWSWGPNRLNNWGTSDDHKNW